MKTISKKWFYMPLAGVIAVFVASGLIAGILAMVGEYRPGGLKFQKTWTDFYHGGMHEPDLDDPLIAAGKNMTVAICGAIGHPNMKRRRYAIGALGFIGDRRALPTLVEILQNRQETNYFRGDALLSIYQIDHEAGIEYARQYLQTGGLVKEIAEAILRRDPSLMQPTEE